MEIIWSQRAVRQLEAITCCIACDAPQRATVFVDRIIHATTQLARHPNSGKKMRQLSPLRQLVIQKYRIVYRVRKTVEIIAVLGPRQQRGR